MHGKPMERNCNGGTVWDIGRSICNWAHDANREECLDPDDKDRDENN